VKSQQNSANLFDKIYRSLSNGSSFSDCEKKT